MNFGYGQMATYGFIGVGFWIVLAVALGLCLTFPLGSARGRVAAQRWVNGCVLLLVLGGIADIAWAVISGQWSAFMLQFGFGPLAEMMVLAALFVGTMWWMAIRYTAGLKD
ncbi:MAG: hypothetical protein HGB10_10765 [Coriobacteriia bacterium]|nr:hypothetical protein [Coriobacteriia bacterium]